MASSNTTAHRRASNRWRGHREAAVMAVIGSPVAFVALTLDRGAAGARVVDLVAYLVAACGLALCLHEWKRTGRAGYAWSTSAMCVVAAHFLTSVALGALPGLHYGAFAAGDLATALILLGIVSMSRHEPVTTHPMTLGLVAGGVAASLTAAFAFAGPQPTVLVQVMGTGAAVAFLAVAAGIHGREELPSGVRSRVALSVGLTAVVAVGHTLTAPGLRDNVVILAEVAGVLALASACAGLLTSAVHTTYAAVTGLRESLERAELDARRDRQRLHEIDSTVAGIAAANRLLRDNPDLPASRSRSLEGMISAEVDRLSRIVQDAAPDPWCILDLDHLIDNLVVSHQARGRLVTATPSGLHAMGGTDHVTEVVNVLLENAARHGGGAPISVSVRQVDDTAQIVVSDTGPGVSASVRDSLFEWGARGPASSGQGIGLHAARQLMTDQGGYLRVADSDEGATFVVGLQLAAGDYVSARAS